MEKRYTALRIIGTIYKVLGGIVAAVTLLLVLGICLASLLGGAAVERLAWTLDAYRGMAGFLGSALGGLLAGVLAAIYGGAIAVTLYGFGEGIYLLLAIEENTRATAVMMQRTQGGGPPR